MTQPWEADRVRERKWERFLTKRPKCALCGAPIMEDEALVLEERYYCGACVSWHTEEVAEFDAGLEADPTGL